MTIPWEKLEEAALSAAERAYAPYSDYRVGAALWREDGTIATGCNVENASYGLTNCAERTAIFHSVSEGKRVFRALVIAGGKAGKPAFPCGACLQVMAEFCGPDFPVRCIALDGSARKDFRLRDLLPQTFSL